MRGRERREGPIVCEACGAPIAVCARLDVDKQLWVTPRYDAFVWMSVDRHGRAIFRCGPCVPSSYVILDSNGTDHDEGTPAA
jgi:hypothetical protein